MLPQIIYLIIAGIALGISMVQHGQPKEGRYSFWTQLFATIVGFLLLYWGGFFKPLGF